jgi:hypothetical protein
VFYSDLKARIRGLIDDTDATYSSDAFLALLVNQIYEESANKLLAADGSFERKSVELPNVIAQTTDLSQYQAAGKPLQLMFQPGIFEYKQAGLAPAAYQQAEFVDKVSDVTPGQIITDWKWDSGVISFTPSVLAMDIRITGEFMFAPLASEQDVVQITKNFGVVLAYGVAALIGVVRGNQGWIQAYSKKADETFDDVAQFLSRQNQKKIRRVGRMHSGRRWRRSVNPR